MSSTRRRTIFCFQKAGIPVGGENIAPELANSDFSMDEDEVDYDLDLTLAYSDANGNLPNWSTLEVVSEPNKVTYILNNPSPGHIAISGISNQNGADSFSVRVQDSAGAWSNTLTVNITINPVADAPVLENPISFNFDEGESGILNIDDYYSHPDSTARRTTSGSIVCTSPTHGSLSIDQASGEITYTPDDLEWSGVDSFDVYVFDINNVQSNTATVNVTVDSVNDIIQVADHITSTFENNAVIVSPSDLHLAWDYDGSVDWETVEIGTPPSHGDVSVNPTTGDITYLPAVNNRTTVTFTWRVQDNLGVWSPYATVTVEILESPFVQAMNLLNAVGVYRLNEVSGTSFADSSGNSRAAGVLVAGSSAPTLNAGTPAANQRGTGKDGSPVIQFNDANTYINIPDTDVIGVFNGANFSWIIMAADPDGTWSDAETRIIMQMRESPSGAELNILQVLASGAAQWVLNVSSENDSQTTSVLSGTAFRTFGEAFDNTDGTNTIRYYMDETQVGVDANASSPSGAIENMSLRISNNSNGANGLRIALAGFFATTLTLTQFTTVSRAWYDRWKYETLTQLLNEKGVNSGISIPNNYDTKSSEWKAIVNKYNILSTENAPKYSTLYYSGRGSPNWTPLTQNVLAAQNNGSRHDLHTLFWHSDTPYLGFMANTRAAAEAEITARLSELRAKYDAEGWQLPYAIDVCNEIMNDGASTLRTTHKWATAFGDGTGSQDSARDWIYYSFHEAKKFFPESLLILADYQIEDNAKPKASGFLSFVQTAVAAGVPIDGIHMQAHWIHGGTSRQLPNSGVLTQIAAFKALNNRFGNPLYVGFSEMDMRTTNYGPPDSASPERTVSSGSATTINVNDDIFDSGMVGWTVVNLDTGATAKIVTYNSPTQAVLDTSIGSTWNGNRVAMSCEFVGTAHTSSSSGTTLVSSAALFNPSMVGLAVMNTTDNDVAIITAYINSTTVTVSKNVDTWGGDDLLIGQNAMWFYIGLNLSTQVNSFKFWNLTDEDSWLGDMNYGTLRNADLSKKPAWEYLAKGIYLSTQTMG